MIEKLNVTKIIKVPIDKVWLAISHIDGLERWFSVISQCQVKGRGVGAIRTLTLVDGGVIRDLIKEINHEIQQFSYQRIELPFPISHYQGTVNLTSTSVEETKLSWSVEYQVTNENRSEMSALILSVITDGINGIEQDLQN